MEVPDLGYTGLLNLWKGRGWSLWSYWGLVRKSNHGLRCEEREVRWEANV